MKRHYTITPEGRLRYEFRMPQYWMPGGMEQCVMDFFDFEHFGYRHREVLGHAKLLERGDDHFVMEMPQVAFGRPLPKLFNLRLRGVFEPPDRLDMILDSGPLRGSVTSSRCWEAAGRTFVEETHALETDDTPYFRALMEVLPLGLPLFKRFSLWRATVVREQDFVAFGHMARNYLSDRFAANGVLLRYPPGGRKERMAHASTRAITHGCADCGRHEMGYRHDGKVRCALCDFIAAYSTPEYELSLEGAAVSATKLEARAQAVAV